MNKLAFLLFTVALFSPAFAQESNKTQQVATNTKNVTITGTIKNFDEFKAAVVPETYIQLVPMSATGSFQTLYGNDGSVSYYSNLPKMPVPKDAAFSFHLSNLPPGRYFIAAQRLKSATYGRIPNGFLINEQHVFILVVEAGDQSPRTIAAGDLRVWTH
jgi:hypothetical protein